MSRLFVEQSLKLDPFIPGRKGTADAIVVRAPDLDVVDLKYGTGIKVEAENNPQCMIYALGAWWALKDKHVIERVHIHIVQPRLNHFDKWTISADALASFGEVVKKSVALCLEDDAPLNPSEKACRWCKAQASCPALYEHNMAVVGDDFAPMPAAELTDDQLRMVLDNKSLIEKWLKSVEAHVFGRLETGGTLAGYKMVEGKSNRKWNSEAESVLTKLLGDGAFEKKLIGLTAAEKAIGKKQLSELGITEKPPGKPTLVHEDDPRKAITIADDFSDETKTLK